MDFGSYAGYGIPCQVVTAATPRSTVTFDYDDESDHVAYPIPASPLIEGGSRPPHPHGRPGRLPAYELFDARKVGRRLARRQRRDLGPALERAPARPAGRAPTPPACRSCPASSATTRSPPARSTTRCGSRPTGRGRATSTRPATRPAIELDRRCRRWACGSASRRRTTPAGLSPQARVIAVALKRYGMILADNGSPWYITGASDPRFDDDVLHELDAITGRDLEVVDTTGLVNGP